MINGYVPIETLMAKLYRDLNLNSEIDELSVVEWSAEALKMIGAYSQFEEISECLELHDGKAKLPCGFYQLVDIHYNGIPLAWATNQAASNYQCEGCKIPCCVGDYTFYINDYYLITNLDSSSETGTTQNVCIIYQGIPTDEKGYPMVPDHVYYHKALAAYVTYMLDRQEWRKGKIPDKVYQASERDWLFYVNSARGAANMPNIAQLENLKNIWSRMRPLGGEYNKHFINNRRGNIRRIQ
jgi:hypothetical protein